MTFRNKQFEDARRKEVVFSKDLRILVVDDITSMRNIIVTMLKEIGFNNIEKAEDGSEAWNMIEEAQKKINLINLSFPTGICLK